MILNIRKPKGMTSHDVVDKVREITKEQRVGHAGTLDPFATGVLVIGVQRESTKLLGKISKDSEKEYRAVLELGKTSDTGDPEGNVTDTGKIRTVSQKEFKEVLNTFKGRIKQTPPKYSAVKIKGVPAYKLARQGKEVHLSPRTVTIYDITLTAFKPPVITLKITCSAGTYIRTLAKDIGEKLGTGAYLRELERTRVGEYTLSQSIPLEKLRELLDKNNTK